MSTNLIDLRQARPAGPGDLPGLGDCLAQLVGEPFRFVRVSYGDELTLHFGELRPARSPKLKGKLYGSYILGARGSPWIIKGGASLALSTEFHTDALSGSLGRSLSKAELETETLIQPDSRVLSATAFVVKPAMAYGLHLATSDGGALLILPAPGEIVQETEDDALPVLADWELLSPSGQLAVGPGLVWAFTPSSE